LKTLTKASLLHWNYDPTYVILPFSGRGFVLPVGYPSDATLDIEQSLSSFYLVFIYFLWISVVLFCSTAFYGFASLLHDHKKFMDSDIV